LEPAAALESLGRALEMAPEDLQANRRMLAWGKGEQKIRAARILCEIDDDLSVLIEAGKVLRGAGCQVIGSIRVFNSYLRGWAAWSTFNAPELVIVGDGFEVHQLLESDPDHFLRKAGFSKCVSFERALDSGQNPRWVYLKCGEEISLSKRISSRKEQPAKPAESRSKKAPSARKLKPALTIVIPVYRDFKATRACLESVRRETAKMSDCMVLLINDASPEPEIAPYLESFAKRTGATLLTNAHNMGFVGSVNRALALIPGGDIILLNADTVLPGTALQRLRETARKNERIGTITPLSNNGEFTSFPIPLHANPLPNLKTLAALDRAAMRVNKDCIIDIPSGIGFCLFISAACFKAVGSLSDCFQGGYLEDVDFCLRAREKGFRNVCDPSIFVAHAGSRSFLADKHNLVVRNLPIIEERFPGDQAETKAFLKLDPLRPARAAIEKALTSKAAFDVLIVTGPGLIKSIVQERARRLQLQGQQAWFAIVTNGTVRFSNAAEAMPRSLQFRWDSQQARGDLSAYLRGLSFGRIELADPAKIPPASLSLLCKGGQPLDLLISDGRWMLTSEKSWLQKASAAPCNPWEEQVTLMEIWSKVSRIIAPSDQARGFVQHFVPDQKDKITVQDLLPTRSKSPRSRRKKEHVEDGHAICGLLSYGRLSDDFIMIKELAMRTRRKTKAASFIVFGETFDDLDLMALDNVFVTAAIDADELSTLCRLYGIDKLFAATCWPLFGHPLTSAAKVSGLPLAYFDWSYGACKPARAHLALAPGLDMKAIASQLAAWMAWLP